ncbi:MAG: 4-(cytidine 5'-diphospho)-2-C-methyl-D-erythritol kinase [Salinivirgaceae bacterium]|nr:MAG: 4-(cytidine 5'-diphospho)-2-C-methyl-D-erythritol kinase [Salinivirgaceae bacterium]
MIAFSNAKINIGLQVKRKRPDGFHELETLFYPIPLTDVIEILPHNKFLLEQNGPFAVDCPIKDNLVYKAYDIVAQDYAINPVRIILHKNIPSGAGLGGGSSNAAYTLKLLNEIHDLKLDSHKLEEYAAKLGSDCAFFIKNKPAIATGRGEILKPYNFSLKGKYLVLVIPEIHISTAEAYGGISPKMPDKQLDRILTDQNTWKANLKNDFENHIFTKHKQLQSIKDELYKSGAYYAAMSGSGSSMFGLFNNEPEAIELSNIRLQKTFQLEI